MPQHSTVGLLYPGYAAEDDYPLIAERLGPSVSLRVVHTSVGEDAHRVDALLDLGSAARLSDGVRELSELGAVDAVVWACTSGSFVFGWHGAQQQADGLSEQLGVPASSTSFGFVHAASALGLRKVAVVATYPQDVADYFVRFLDTDGVHVLQMSSQGIVTAAEVGTLSGDAVIELAVASDHPDADAVLLPDTALHTVAVLDELEVRLGKPVLTANQVSAWEGMHLAGHTEPCSGLGTLFRSGCDGVPVAARKDR